MRAKRTIGKIIYHVLVCGFGLIMIYPLVWMVMSAFKPTNTIFTTAGQLIPEDKGGFVIFLFPQLRKGNVKLNSGFPDVESQETVAEIIHAGFCPADSRRPAGEVLHHRNGKDSGKRAGRLPGLHGGTAERRHIDKHLLRRSGSGEKSRKEQKRHQQTGQPFSEFRTRDPASPSPGEVFSGTGIQTHLLSFRNLRLTNRVLFQLYSILQGKEVRSAIFFCL